MRVGGHTFALVAQRFGIATAFAAAGVAFVILGLAIVTIVRPLSRAVTGSEDAESTAVPAV